MPSFLFSRMSFVMVSACAVVVSFIISPHAAKAYPSIPPSDGGMEPSLSSYKRFSLLSSEPGSVSGTSTERDGDAPSVIYVQPNLLRKGHLNYNPNSRPNQPHFEGMTRVQGGQNLGEVKPASNSFRMNHNPAFRGQNGGASRLVAPNNGNFQSLNSPILRKSSQQQSPHPQSASQVHKAYDYEQIPRSGSSALPKSRSEERIDWQSPESSRRFWSSRSNTKGHNSDDKEAHAGTSGVQSIKAPSFVYQKSFLFPSASSRTHSSVIEPEKLTSSITTQLSQGEFPSDGNGKTSYKRVQSYLLRNFQTTEAPKGVNTQRSQHVRGQVFNQQARENLQSTNSMQIRNGNKFAGHVGDTIKTGPASAIYRAPKQDTLTPYEDPNGAKTNAKDAESSTSDTRKAPTHYVPPKGYFRPYRLQKYSFGQRVSGPKSPSLQEYGAPNNIKMKSKSGAGSAEQKGDSKPLTKLSERLKLVALKPRSKLVKHGKTLTPFNRRYKQKVQDMNFEAVTYDDIIGSASFSSVSPAKIVTNRDDFEKSKITSPKESVEQNQTVDLVDETEKTIGIQGNATEDFRKGERETELGMSDSSVSEKESEAVGVPQGSDPEENIENDSLLEMDYLRTSTGNITFQSLNLNL